MGEYHTVFSNTTVELSQEFLENFHDPAIVLSYVKYLASSKESEDALGDIEWDVLEGSFRATASWATICTLYKFLEDFLVRHKAQDGDADQDSGERAWNQEPVENDDCTLDDVAASVVEIVDEAACSREDAPAAEFAATVEIHSARVDSNVRETSSFLEKKCSNLGATDIPARSREINNEYAAPQHSEQSDFLQRILKQAATDREWEFPERIRNLSVVDKLDKCPEPVVVLNFDPGLNIHESKAKSVKEVEQILKDVYKMQDGSRERSDDTSLPRPSDCDEASAASAEDLCHNSLPVASKQKIDSPELICQQSSGSDADAQPIVRDGHGTKDTRRLHARNIQTQTQEKFEASSLSDTFCLPQNEHSAPKTGRKRGRPPKALRGKDTREAFQDKATKQIKLLYCSKCPYKTKYPSDMRVHHNRHHSARDFHCEVCGKAFGSHRDLKLHEETHKQPQNRCNVCGKMYKGKKTLEAHRRKHDENYRKPEFPCEICDKAFCTKYVLARHIKQEHLGLKKTYLCPTCGKSFHKRYSYVRHASTHLGVKPYQCEQTKLLYCSKCPYKTKYPSDMTLHKRRLHIPRELQCKVCGKAYGSRGDLKRHEETHEQPQNCCDVCGKMFKVKKTLMAHRRKHDKNYKKPEFPCEICHKAFCTKYVLARHIKQQHLGVRKTYLCPTCGKSFQRRDSYIQHASVHLGVKPYQCETCGKNFPYKRSLELHRFTHDEVERFSCSVCNKKFRQSSSLNTHMKIHTDTKNYICSSCGKGFVQRQALIRHERIHQGDKPFQCLLCQREFSDASILRRHMILVHKKDKKKWQEDTKVDHSTRQRRTLRAEPPPPPHSAAEPPRTTAEQPSSTAEPPPSSTAEPPSSTAQPPSSAAEQQPSSTAEPPPSSTAEQQPSSTAEPPLSDTEPSPPNSAEPPPSTAELPSSAAELPSSTAELPSSAAELPLNDAEQPPPSGAELSAPSSAE